ncbi:MAG: hypothetical protein E7271_13060 [Lachnospiraceae bacterium]|nr:hypothetical protein [Lachnospiraceae bacterium]
MKATKRLIMTFVAVFAMALALSVTSISAQAATKKKKVTMLTGEKASIYVIGGKIKSVSSSKKKVCAAKKKGKDCIITAKKAGKAKVTIKTTNGSLVYTVTVKSNPFKVSCTPLSADTLLVEVKNSSNVYFESATISNTLCDAAGIPVTTKNCYIYNLGANDTAYATIKVYETGIDLTKTMSTVPEYSRSIDYKYSKYNGVQISEPYLEGRYVKERVSTNYSNKRGYVKVAVDIAFYNAAGQIIKVDTDTFSLDNINKVKTSYGNLMPSDAVSYAIISKRVFKKEY